MSTLNSRHLPLGFRRAMKAAAKVEPQARCASIFMPMRVPTVGLHDKLGNHRDSPALRQAKETYARSIPQLARPIAPPICLTADFVLTPAEAGRDPGKKLLAHFDGVLPWTGKPDLDNLVKVLADSLRLRCWMTDDAPIVCHETNKWISFDKSLQGVWLSLRTLAEVDFAEIEGARLHPNTVILSPEACTPAGYL